MAIDRVTSLNLYNSEIQNGGRSGYWKWKIHNIHNRSTIRDEILREHAGFDYTNRAES